MIGTLAFVAEYISFFLLISATPQLLVAQSLSFLIGLAVSFHGNRSLTFNQSDSYKLGGRSQLWRYLLLALFNLLLTNVLIYSIVNHLVIDPVFAKLFVMGLVVAWNYLIFSKFIFKTK